MQLYLKGFIKGIGILILFFLIYGFMIFITQNDVAKIGLQLIGWFSGIFCVSFLCTKYHLDKGWATAGIFFTWFLLPFLFGIIEMEKKSNV